MRRGLLIYGHVGEGRGKSVLNQQREREAGEADKAKAAPGMTVGSLRRFRAALVGPTQGILKRRRLRR